MTTSSPPPRPWLFGATTDLLFGCGLVAALAFVALGIDGDAVRAVLPMAWTPLLVLLTGIPHYGATLLRVYEHRADRRRYLVFSGYLTAALALAFVAGAYQVAVGSWLLTLYLTWSPWHYSGQNYGIALMFLGRRGVQLPPFAKHALQASFVLSFLLAALMLHAVDSGVSYAPGSYDGTVYQLLRFAPPDGLVAIAMPALAAGYVATLAIAVHAMLLRASLRQTLPVFALLASQALWFAVPALARHAHVLQGFEPFGTEHATYAFLWVAMAHSVQYLWITRYFARARGAASGSTFGAKVLLSGAAVWVIPALLFAPGVLGRVPYDAGLALLIASVVNLHHFILDGAIWKLRDGPIARALLRGEGEEGSTPQGSAWPSRLVWAAGAASVGVWTFSTIVQAGELQPALAAGDVERVERAADRLAWIGQESARVHAALATLHQHRGNAAPAQRHAERTLALHAGVDELFELSTFFHRSRRSGDAIASIERALTQQPGSPRLRHRLAWLLIVYHRDEPAQAQRARDLAAAAVADTGGRNASYLHTYGMALAATGALEEALATAEHALATAIAAGEKDFIDLLRRHRDGYAQALGR